MLCPRCRAGVLHQGATACPLCGYVVEPGADADPALAVIERTVRKELRDDFTIESLQGRGGMSIVYVARERELSRQVALKVLPLQLVMGRDAVERFTREAKIAASLDHPNIVPVHRIGTASTFLWYTMKLVRGRSLADVLAAGRPLSLQETLHILEPVASALQHAHQRGVVHRDVKPANILIDETGWVSVCDFGIAKAFGAVPLTHSHAAVGTPGYMSPEQCYGRPLDGRSDQYALGILAYECLTGRLPFTADSLGEIVQKHCSAPAPRVTDVRRDVPEPVADAIQRAMRKNPDERFASVVEFVEGLGGTPVRVGNRFTPVDLRGWDRAPSGRRIQPGHWGLLIAAAAVVVFGLWLTSRRRTDGVDTTAPPAEVTLAPAYLSVNATPWGEVYVDDRHIGPTPQLDIALTAGSHGLRVQRPGFESYTQTVELAPNDSVRLTAIVLKPAGR